MELLVAACGLLCNKCPAYEATKNNDHALIEQTARQWSALYGVEVKPEHVWCTGCMTEGGPKSWHCGNSCEIRKCIVARNYETCAECAELAGCSKLAGIAEHVPPAKALLETLCAFRKQFSEK